MIVYLFFISGEILGVFFQKNDHLLINKAFHVAVLLQERRERQRYIKSFDVRYATYHLKNCGEKKI